ncbi:MAG: Outer membrane protein TolC precursor [Deltaproteobacteria bacterium ADurb.Bin510]|nr:MAG: Outer membrane protein TolC precursor [Deltaproteobacteria bacterium ADurb.Bin510]
MEVSNNEPAVTQNLNYYEAGLLALKDLLGLSPDAELELTGAMGCSPAEPAPLDELYRAAMAARPEYRLADLEKRLAAQNVTLEKAGHYPYLNAFASRSFQGQTDDSFPGSDERSWALTAGVRLNLPLFSGGSVSSRVKQADLALRTAEENLASAERGLKITVKKAWLELREASQRLASHIGRGAFDGVCDIPDGLHIAGVQSGLERGDLFGNIVEEHLDDRPGNFSVAHQASQKAYSVKDRAGRKIGRRGRIVCLRFARRRRAKSLGQFFGQRRQRDGLGDIIVHPGFETFFAVALHRVCGHRNDQHIGIADGGVGTADAARGFQAVHFGHLYIHQHQVIIDHFQRLDGFSAVGHGIGVEAELLEQSERDLLVGNVVVGQQDAQGTIQFGRYIFAFPLRAR